ncbi:hypothetical protein [Acrocarpospora macrocephala]|nr:hypothetical protein [Acrocarpospora macrocephala]
MAEEMSPEQARDALEHTDRLSRRVRARAYTMRLYLVVCAAGNSVALLVIGLVEPIVLKNVLALATTILPFAAITLWYRRLPVLARTPPPPRWGAYPYAWGTWLLWCAAAGFGTLTGLDGRPEYWIPAALVVAAPLTFAALKEPRP